MQAAPTVTLESARLDPERSLATFGKTFHWASLALGERYGARVRALYALCRYADDLVDEGTRAEAEAGFAGLWRDLDRGWSRTPAVARFLQVARETRLDLEPVRELLRGVASDLEPVRPSTLAELERYAYRVAGTVGLVLCRLFDMEERRALPFAVDLGIAMQLTNVARDVLEDAGRDRVYLPVELLGKPVAPYELVEDLGDARERARAATLALLDRAERFYRSADLGVRHLPARARIAVLTASRCYEAIGEEIRRDPSLPFAGRAFVGTGGKVWHTARALAGLVFDPGYWSADVVVDHDPRLHVSLAGLAGVDARAT